MSEENRGWTEWSQYVLKELERLNESYSNVNQEINDLKVEVGKLQVKASIWGGLAGIITALIMYLIKGG